MKFKTKNNTILKVNNLNFSFLEEEKNFFDNLSFEIKKGDYLFLVGSNGSGKSTLVKIILDLEKIKSGKIEFYGNSMGIIFQEQRDQFISNTPREDIHLTLQGSSDYSKESVDKKIEDIFSEFGILNLIDRDFESFSGGEIQRVAISIQLALNNDFVIFDESTSMIDKKVEDKINLILKDINKNRGVTILRITHNPENIINGNKVIVLDHGKLIFQGGYKDLFLDQELISKAKIKLPFAYELSKRLNKHSKDVKITFSSSKLLANLKSMKN